MKLSRTDWKYLVDTLMFLCLLGIAGIGFLLALVIPEGRVGPARSKYWFGLHRHQWGDIHFILSAAFVVFIVIHLLLSWSWIRAKAGRLFGKAAPAALGLTAAVALIIPAVFWLGMPKNDPAYAELGAGRGTEALEAPERERAVSPPPAGDPAKAPAAGKQDPPAGMTVGGRQEAALSDVVITGRMTLREVERATGVPPRDLWARLGLPGDVSPDETIGRFRRTYGLEMQAIRDALAELGAKKRRRPAP